MRPRFQLRSSGFAALLAMAGASCQGSIDAPSMFPGSNPSSEGPAASGDTSAPSGSNSPTGSTSNDEPNTPSTPGASDPTSNVWPKFGSAQAFQLRRLTTEQYVTTVQTLLGVDTSAMPPIEHVSPAGGFSAIGASTVSVTAMGVSQFEEAARYLAHAAYATDGPGRKRMPCTPSGAGDTTCFTSFVSSFGQKAFRRPLTTDERDRYVAATSDIAKTTNDPWQAIEAIVSAFLQSPSFLYLPEVGAPDPKDATRYRYDAYEMASRLSYFFTNDMPDDALLAAAASGELLTPDGITKQVARLQTSTLAHTSVGAFFSSLLSLDDLETLSRPKELFPKYSPTLGPALRQETLRVIEDLVFSRDTDYRRLFDQKETFVNAELAALYGVSAPSGGDFQRVTLPDASHRAGLLGQAGVLAARDHSDETSPTRRGLFVLTRLLCEDLPLMPPAGLQIPQPPGGLITARQRLQEHATNAVCASCHSVTDPVGLSLEHFDAMGTYRENDHGMAIDDTGTIDGMTYHGVVELGALLRDHPALAPCLIQSLYGVAVGHLATEFDRKSFSSLVAAFDDDGARVLGLLASIAASDGFRYSPKPSP